MSDFGHVDNETEAEDAWFEGRAHNTLLFRLDHKVDMYVGMIIWVWAGFPIYFLWLSLTLVVCEAARDLSCRKCDP